MIEDAPDQSAKKEAAADEFGEKKTAVVDLVEQPDALTDYLQKKGYAGTELDEERWQKIMSDYLVENGIVEQDDLDDGLVEIKVKPLKEKRVGDGEKSDDPYEQEYENESAITAYSEYSMFKNLGDDHVRSERGKKLTALEFSIKYKYQGDGPARYKEANVRLDYE
jgi:hypothetical protein